VENVRECRGEVNITLSKGVEVSLEYFKLKERWHGEGGNQDFITAWEGTHF